MKMEWIFWTPHYSAKHFSEERRLHYANMIDKGEEQANEWEWEWDLAIAFSRPGPTKKFKDHKKTNIVLTIRSQDRCHWYR
jgi:hypothetical protein